MAKIGYIRVSKEHQETARQQELMKSIGVDKIYMEKVSGKNTNRPQLQAMMNYLRDGDILYIKSISRLSRSVRDLLAIVDELSSKCVQFVSSKENIDTMTPQGRFVMQIFAALSELEREQTLQRQREGIAIAKVQGKYKGKAYKKIDEALFKKLYKKWKAKEITAVEFGRKIGLKHNSLYRRIKRFETTNKIN